MILVLCEFPSNPPLTPLFQRGEDDVPFFKGEGEWVMAKHYTIGSIKSRYYFKLL